MPSDEVAGTRLTGAWVWLFPASQALHVIEEYFQGYVFHLWLRGAAEASFSTEQTQLMHLAFVIAMSIAAWIAIHFQSARWIVVALGVLVLLNSLSHAVGAIVAPWATSGLITSIGVWLPLSGVALVKSWRYLPRLQFVLGVAVGAAVQAPISWWAALAG